MSVQGAKRLMRKLARLPPEIQAQIKQVLKNQAQELAEDMRQRVPVSDVPTHGVHLRDRIGVRISRSGLSAKIGVILGAPRGLVLFTFRRGGRKHTIKATVPAYSRFLEFGTRKMTKRPFVFPAWRSRREEVRASMRKAVNAALAKVAAAGESDV